MSIPQHMDPHVEPGAGKFDPDQLEVAPGRQRESVEGWIPELATEQELREALEKAFDYRGDVTLTRKDGSKVEGYIFDRRSGKTLIFSSASIPKIRTRRFRFPTLRSRLWLSVAATPQPAGAGKPGSGNTGRSERRERRTSASRRKV